MNRFLIFASAALRAAAVSFSSVFLTMHLSAMGFGAGLVAFSISLGLAGCAFGTFLTTFLSDRFGRRASLAALSFLMALGGLGMASGSSFFLIFLSLFAGMVNGMGRDRGAGLTVEQAMLAEVTAGHAARTKTFAWYNLIVDAANAVGAFLSFLPSFFRMHSAASLVESYQWAWMIYAALCLAAGVVVFGLSRAVEPAGRPVERLSEASRPLVKKFVFLSGMDSFGGGFLSTALLSYWFFLRFGVNESFLAPFFFIVRVANGLSHLGAAWLAKRIGLVNTMVFTHLPSSALLFVIPFMPHLWLAVALFLVRESLVEMDVPTRQSYLLAIVKPEERTFASGLTNLTRGIAWSAASFLAGPLMGVVSFSAPLFTGAGIKIAYDLLLYRSFRQVPEGV